MPGQRRTRANRIIDKAVPKPKRTLDLKGPRRLTPEVIDAICEAIVDGCHARTATEAIGVSDKTFREWRLRGEREPDTPYGEFRRRLEIAEAERAGRLVSLIREAASPGKDVKGKIIPGDWRAAAWLLERLHPADFGPRATIRVEGKVDHMHVPDIERALEALSHEELEQLRSLHRKLERGRDRPGDGTEEPDRVLDAYDATLPRQLAPSPDS